MTISYVNSNTADFTATNNAVVTTPAGVQAGDLLLVQILAPWPLGTWATNFSYVERRTLTAPDSGWWVVDSWFNVYGTTTGPAPDFFTAYLYELHIVLAKVATGSEPASYTFNLNTLDIVTGLPSGTTTTGAIGAVAYRGVDTTSPIMAHYATYGASFNGYGTFAGITGASTLKFSVPVTNALSVLFYGARWPGATGTIVEPGGVTERYNRAQSINNQGSISAADIPVTGTTSDVYTWTITANPDASCSENGHIIILRPASQPQGLTWTPIFSTGPSVNESPSLFFQNDDPQNIYTAELNFETIWGSDLIIKRLSAGSGAVQATFDLQSGNPNFATVDNAASINVIECDCPSNNLYFSTYGDDGTGPGSFPSYVFRLDTATLTQQAQSPDFEDAPRSLRVGRKGTWSGNSLFITHYGLGTSNDLANIMVRQLDKTTLIQQGQLLLGSFFTAGELGAGSTYQFGNMDTDANGDVWLAVTFGNQFNYDSLYLFKIDSSLVVTKYDLTDTFNPTHDPAILIGRASVGYDRKTGYLILAGEDTYNYGIGGFGGASKIIAVWNPLTASTLATFTSPYLEPTGLPPGFASTGNGYISEIHPSLFSDATNSSDPTLWVASEALSTPHTFSYLLQLSMPTLALRQTLTMPPGYSYAIDPTLDVSRQPNRLWVWLGRFNAPQLGNGIFELTNHPKSEQMTLFYLDFGGTATYTGAPCSSPPVPCITLPCDPMTLRLPITDQRTLSLR